MTAALSKYFDAVVLGRRNLTERIIELEIGAADGSPLPMAEAGSHIELRFGPAGGPFHRQYSVVGRLGLDGGPEPFRRIAVQREDRSRGSAYIHSNFRIGTLLRISRPIGSFRLSRNLPHVLLIAAGIGITPILPMLRSLIIRGQSFSMLYIGAEKAAMAYADDVLALGGDAVRLHETSRTGRPDLDDVLASQPPGTHVYICGPGPMIDSVRAIAEARHWHPARIRYEVFNAAHRPEDNGFRVRLRSGRFIEVGAGTTILDALETAGVDTLSDCRRGECGLCLTDVLNAREGIDHRDSYLTTTERTAADQLTICCSRAHGTHIDLDID
ncbi:PDR/VanB family oxidoreductase [Nocardia miyunensis]|uniref:PDR/VanB family oxidoreductase n=1 Tax=Nocardia miyunensis TaxID=282684 RepID=UPI000ACBDFB8|nr:PDR/VanB family oxidoreductase [Nocardia miyunensis]